MIKNTKFLLNKVHSILQYKIHIDVVKTPNPNFLKFIPNECVVLGASQGTLDISESKFASISPLAQDLFSIKGITRVFYAKDYLSIAKEDDMDWQALKPQIYKLLSQYFDQKKPILSTDILLGNQRFYVDEEQINPNDSQAIQFIKQILACRIRPNVQEDGGDVKFVNFDQQTGILKLKLVGACSGCPSSASTLKGGIQKMLTYYVKQVKQVVSQDQ